MTRSYGSTAGAGERLLGGGTGGGRRSYSGNPFATAAQEARTRYSRVVDVKVLALVAACSVVTFSLGRATAPGGDTLEQAQPHAAVATVSHQQQPVQAVVSGKTDTTADLAQLLQRVKQLEGGDAPKGVAADLQQKAGQGGAHQAAAQPVLGAASAQQASRGAAAESAGAARLHTDPQAGGASLAASQGSRQP